MKNNEQIKLSDARQLPSDVLVCTGLCAVLAERDAPYSRSAITQFVPRPARKESNVQSLGVVMS